MGGPRGRVRFRETEIRRAVRAAQAAGLTVGSVVVDPATEQITVHTDKPGEPTQPTNEPNPWDKVLKDEHA